MTRYLDREPRRGDRVVITYEAEYDHLIPGRRHLVRVTDGSYLPVVPPIATVRVIAPEPKVGDLVTDDMDLPEGSIIECITDRFISVVTRHCGMWRHDTHSGASPVFGNGSWRIVRIGGAA